MMLEGKVALITGGGAGIGVAIAQRFVAEGAKVCISGRRQEKLDEVARSLPKGTVATVAGDVTVYEEAQRMVDAAVEFGGKLDVLVNNAGIDQGGLIVDLDPKVWHDVIETNLTGPFYLMKFAIPHMVKNGGGSIINMASLAGVRCLPNMAAYCSAKAGLIMLTQQAALDYGRAKIRCNAVLPGPVRTEMVENSMIPMAQAMGVERGRCVREADFVPSPAPDSVHRGSGRHLRLPVQRRRELSSPLPPSWWTAAQPSSIRAAQLSAARARRGGPPRLTGDCRPL